MFQHLIPEGEKYIYSEEGYPKIEVNMFGSFYEGNRNLCISMNIRKLIMCNEGYDESELQTCLWSMMKNGDGEPLSNGEFNGICRRAFKENRDGKLQPILSKTRWHYITVDGYDGRTARGEHQSNQTKELIYNALEDWDWEKGKITQQKVADTIGKSIGTVKNYWSNFKGYARVLNQENKQVIKRAS